MLLSSSRIKHVCRLLWHDVCRLLFDWITNSFDCMPYDYPSELHFSFSGDRKIIDFVWRNAQKQEWEAMIFWRSVLSAGSQKRSCTAAAFPHLLGIIDPMALGKESASHPTSLSAEGQRVLQVRLSSWPALWAKNRVCSVYRKVIWSWKIFSIEPVTLRSP